MQQKTDPAFPAAVDVLNFNNQDFLIQPFLTGRLPAVLSALAPIIHLFKMDNPPDVAQLLLLHAEDALQLIAVLANHERAVIDALALDDLLQLATRLLEVNADFFLRRVLPKLSGLASAMKELRASNTPVAATGPMPSSF